MGYQPRNRQILELSSGERQYTQSLILILFISNLIVCGPCFYFIQKNYSLFLELAESQQTFLIEQLIMEKNRLYFVLIFALGLNLFVSAYLIISHIKRWSMPLRVLKAHLEQAAEGNYNLKAIFIRQSDELHDLIRNYNTVYEAAKSAKNQKATTENVSLSSEEHDSRRVS